ncbi:MAG TPA: hypothetical protein VMU09_13440, partial [Acidimicrobiales bacterium]|nr:hypothetical protein [Acidimicrobiales bacterium]
MLGPSLLRKRAERHSGDSIGAFHRQLRVLEHAGPSLVDPANRMASMRPMVPVGPHPPNVRHDPFFRPEACRRRRDVLVVLTGTTVVTGLLGIIPSMQPVLFLTAIGLAALVGYIVLIVRLRSFALEREVKLRYLPQAGQAGQAEPTFVVRRVAAR